jgi:predicted HTH domain antitoxin
MTVSFNLPNEIEDQLRVAFGDLGEAAKNALLVTAYRQGTISIGRLAATKGMGVIEAQKWLSDQGIPINYGLEAYEADCRTIAQLFPQG